MKNLEKLGTPALAVFHDDAMVKPKKSHYSSPVFQVYGSVSLLTMGSSGTRNDGGGAMRMRASDRHSKENIVRIGKHPLGFGLCLFDYKPEFRDQWGFGRQFGVLADEVETVLPQAVSLHRNGYKMVDYGMLGIIHTIK